MLGYIKPVQQKKGTQCRVSVREVRLGTVFVATRANSPGQASALRPLSPFDPAQSPPAACGYSAVRLGVYENRRQLSKMDVIFAAIE